MSFQEHERIFFTGQSGIQITKSLNKFLDLKQKEYLRNDKNIKLGYFKVETEIATLYIAGEGSNLSSSSNEIWRLILNLPYAKIQKLWNEAILKIIEKIEKEEQSNKIFISFISFHSVFFHKRTNEYFSCLNVDLLSNLQPTKIITLIDDIYDIHSRLQKPDELFDHKYDCKLIDLILDLFVILDWRARKY